MNIKVIKAIAVVTSVVGAVTSLVGAFANDKLLDDKISTKVSDALAKSTLKD